MSNTITKSKWINTAQEAKQRLKWILIGHAIFWGIWGIMVLIFGDESLALAANPGFAIDETNWGYKIIKFYSDLNYALYLVTLVGTLLVMVIPKCQSYRRPMLEVLYTLLFGLFMVGTLKPLVGRLRPFQEGSPIANEINTFGEATDSGSMPSGHATATSANTLPHAVWIRNVIICIIISVFSAGMMYVRMYLGVHYATDVLVSNMIALGCVTLSFFLFQRIYKKGSVTRKQEWIIFVIGLLSFIGSQFLLQLL